MSTLLDAFLAGGAGEIWSDPWGKAGAHLTQEMSGRENMVRAVRQDRRISLWKTPEQRYRSSIDRRRYIPNAGIIELDESWQEIWPLAPGVEKTNHRVMALLFHRFSTSASIRPEASRAQSFSAGGGQRPNGSGFGGTS